MKSLDYILGVLDTLANIATMVPGIAVPASLADNLLKVAQSAVQAHESITGQPLDLSLLAPVPLSTVTAATVTTQPVATIPITATQ